MAVSEATISLYEKLVAMIPDLERKGAAMPYTSRNGHMFSFLTKDVNSRYVFRTTSATRF